MSVIVDVLLYFFVRGCSLCTPSCAAGVRARNCAAEVVESNQTQWHVLGEKRRRRGGEEEELKWGWEAVKLRTAPCFLFF